MIIDDAITPRFRQGDFAGGLQAAVDQLIARVSGEALPAAGSSAQQRGGQGGFDFFDLAILLFIAVPIVGGVLRAMFGRKLGSLVTGGGFGFLAMLITSSLVIAVIAGIVALLFSLLRRGRSAAAGAAATARSSSRRRLGRRWPRRRRAGGGGGFGSGGGGDFGGGGASGDW